MHFSGLAQYRAKDVADIVTFLNAFINSVYVPQRITVTAFFAQVGLAPCSDYARQELVQLVEMIF